MYMYVYICIYIYVYTYIYIYIYIRTYIYIYIHTDVCVYMTKNRFDEINRYFHLNDSALEPRRSEDGYECLYKVRPILNNFNEQVKEVYHPKQNISVDEDR